MTLLLDTLATALATLRANALRSALTLLGIVIAAATLVTVASLTEGLRLRVQADLSLLGAGAFEVARLPSLTVGPADARQYAKRADLTREQGEALRSLPHVGYVSLEERGEPEVLATSARATRREIEVVGAGLDASLTGEGAVARGRFFSEAELLLARRVAFVGAGVADVLFPRIDPVGQRLRIRGAEFEVVGVAERRGSMMGLSKDAFAIVPWTAYESVLGKRRSVRIVVGASDPAAAPLAMDEVIEALRRLRRVGPYEPNDFEVSSGDEAARVLENLTRTVNASTLAVCALALLVGGTGIMNVMLASVAERTREIGVCKALGARRGRILSQFLAESVALSALGGAAGVLLGCALAAGAGRLGAPAAIPGWAVALSLGSALGAGLLFGVYPAARASRLDPVEAMRRD